MRIATRLRIGYVLLVLLLLAITGGTALELHRFGSNIEQQLGQAYRGASTALAVLDELEREHEAVEAALSSADASRAARLGTIRTAVDARLSELAAVTAKDDREVVEEARSRLARYREETDRLLERTDRPLVLEYEQVALPAWEQARSSVRTLLESKQRVMERAASTARQAAWRRAAALAFVVTVALVLFTALSRSLEQRVLAPLESLRSTAEAIAAGDSLRRVIAGEDDELGLIGRQLNRLLDHQQQLLAESEARRNAVRRLLIGLLAALAPDAFVLRLDGEIVAGPPDAPTGLLDEVGEQLADRFRAPSKDEHLSDELAIPVRGGQVARCRLLLAGDGSPAGWLVRIAEAPAVRSDSGPPGAHPG